MRCWCDLLSNPQRPPGSSPSAAWCPSVLGGAKFCNQVSTWEPTTTARPTPTAPRWRARRPQAVRPAPVGYRLAGQAIRRQLGRRMGCGPVMVRGVCDCPSAASTRTSATVSAAIGWIKSSGCGRAGGWAHRRETFVPRPVPAYPTSGHGFHVGSDRVGGVRRVGAPGRQYPNELHTSQIAGRVALRG